MTPKQCEMKKLIFAALLFAAAPAQADITHKLSSSVQLTVNSAATQATRIGNSYSISGNNVTTTDGSTSGAITAGSITDGIYDPGTITATQATAGEAFSFSTSFIEADTVQTTAPTVGEVSAFGSQISNAGGTAGDLAGTIDSSGTMSVTAGGSGTTATGQFVSEITAIQ